MKNTTITLARFPLRDYGKTGRVAIDTNNDGMVSTEIKDGVVSTSEPILGISKKQINDYFWHNEVDTISKSDVGEVDEVSGTFNSKKGVNEFEPSGQTLSDVAKSLNPFPNHSEISDSSPVEWSISRKDGALSFLITTETGS